jgi:hypothetical protein
MVEDEKHMLKGDRIPKDYAHVCIKLQDLRAHLKTSARTALNGCFCMLTSLGRTFGHPPLCPEALSQWLIALQL